MRSSEVHEKSGLWLTDASGSAATEMSVRGDHPVVAYRIDLKKDRAAETAGQLKGRLIGIRGLFALGWAYDANDPEKPVSIELLDGNRVIATGVADRRREDTHAPADGMSHCGFRIRIPNTYLDGRPLGLGARESTSGVYLERPAEPILPSELPGWSAVITDLEDQSLVGRIEIDSPDPQPALELELWIDGIWADRFHVPLPETDRDLIPFRHTLPESVRDGDTWTSVLDGEIHELVLTLADSSLILAAAEFPTPAKAFTYQSLLSSIAAGPDELPRFVRTFIYRAGASALFDKDSYSAKVRQDFPTTAQAVLHYLSDRKNWRHATSPWMDVSFISAVAGERVMDTVSPLEWYLRQGSEADAGPNPLFSNADYCIHAGIPTDARPTGASFFDDWLQSIAKGQPINPSVFVDVDHVCQAIDAGPDEQGTRALDYLRHWLQLRPKERPLGELSPYFDQDWLEQCFILRRNRPTRCLLSAFRLGMLADQSPHPVLQYGQGGRNYYALIRDYELLSFAQGIDEITRVCPGIDDAAFYSQFPRPDRGSNGAGNQLSSFYRYLIADSAEPRPSFLRGLDDDFVANEYSGLVEYCIEARGIADINRIWSRWLRLLRLPGNYADSVDPTCKLLRIQDIKQLRAHPNRLGRGVRASFIIPTYARDDLVLQCVLSALQSGPMDQVEFIIAEDAVHVDGNWLLGYFLPYASSYKNPENLGFLLSCREAVSRSSGDIFILVNNDVIIHRNAIEEMLAAFDSRPDAAVVGGLVLNADGTIQENAGMLWRDASAWNYHRGWKREDEYTLNIREADYVSGCWIGIRRSAWDDIGGFDTRYVPAYYEESDFCLSAWRRGYKVYICPPSVVTHLDGATMGQDEDNPSSLKSYQKINRKKFQRKWRNLLEASHRENGKPTAFHTGRNDPKRFISLVFDHYIPEPDRDAGSRTMFVVCEALAAIPGNYVLFVPANNHRSPYAAALERLGFEVITGAEGWKRLDTLLSQEPQLIKYAFVSRISVAQQFSWHLDQLKCRKSLYIHDIEALRGFQHDPDSPGHAELVKAAMERYMAQHEKLFARFDDVVSLSEDETHLLQPYLGRKLVDVFPYDFAAPEPAEAAAERTDILFVGSYNHPPNREAISNFIENIWPEVHEAIPEARLHLCGSGFENADSLAGDNIARHGMVTDQTLAYLYSISRVSIAPLLTGAGMKGKVVESCAHGVPCVGTELAWQGIDLPDAHVDLSGGISSFGERLLDAYRNSDAETRSSLRALYETWRCRNRMSEVLPELIGQRTRH